NWLRPVMVLVAQPASPIAAASASVPSRVPTLLMAGDCKGLAIRPAVTRGNGPALGRLAQLHRVDAKGGPDRVVHLVEKDELELLPRLLRHVLEVLLVAPGQHHALDART